MRLFVLAIMSLVRGLLILFTVLEYSTILVATAENDPLSIFDGQLVISNVISSRGNREGILNSVQG